MRTSSFKISLFVRYFMLMVSTLSAGVWSDGVVDVVVLSIGAGLEVAESDV